MEGDPDSLDTPRLSLHHGVVVRNNDPLTIGRVTVRVPGIIDEESGWAFPLMLSRGRGVGFYDVPKPGAEVGVWFLLGDTDRPFYVPGHAVAPGGRGQGPSAVQGATPDEAPSIHVWETERHLVLLDERAGREALEMRDKVTGDGIAYDGLTRSLEVKGTVAVKIVSTGAISIDGLTVTINGRAVLPGGPIR